jgi:hypothetical protein
LFLYGTFRILVIQSVSLLEATVRRQDQSRLEHQNVSHAKTLYPVLSKLQLALFRDLTGTLNLSVCRGELLYFDRKWFVSHSGLIKDISSTGMFWN